MEDAINWSRKIEKLSWGERWREVFRCVLAKYLARKWRWGWLWAVKGGVTSDAQTSRHLTPEGLGRPKGRRVERSRWGRTVTSTFRRRKKE